MALIYEVNVAVDSAIVAEYEAWLRTHVLELIANPGFESATILRAEAPAGDNRAHFVTHYAVADRAALDAYFADPGPRGAAALRSDGLSRFGDRMSATRRILERLS